MLTVVETEFIVLSVEVVFIVVSLFHFCEGCMRLRGRVLSSAFFASGFGRCAKSISHLFGVAFFV